MCCIKNIFVSKMFGAVGLFTIPRLVWKKTGAEGIEPPTRRIFRIFFKKKFFIQKPKVWWLIKKLERKKMHFSSRKTHFTLYVGSRVVTLFLTISWYFEIITLCCTPKNMQTMLKHVKGYFLSAFQKFGQKIFWRVFHF